MKYNHNKIKPQAVKDKKYLKWLHEVKQPPCFVCGTYNGIEIHHIKENSTDKRNDDKCIPLCHNHHQGNEFSAHGTPRDFRYTYPIWEQEEKADELYGEFKAGGDYIC